ncbi:MAG TPA: hypothetical protein VI700_02655 [Thermoanaerobaculaceae bacterium]|nr:hypothetical protein [Thermoanaerobaculaceae bacterium]
MRDARAWTHAALFGSLWGAAEASLGTVLKAAHVPLAGLVMASVGVLCLLTVRRLQPTVGISLVTGVVAAFLKVFSLGGLVLGPAAGIVAEAALVELAMTATASSPIGAVVGGALALAEAPLQMAFTAVVISGPEATAALGKAAVALAAGLAVPAASPLAVLAGVVAASALVGAAVGGLSWRVAGRVARRVRGGA